MTKRVVLIYEEGLVLPIITRQVPEKKQSYNTKALNYFVRLKINLLNHQKPNSETLKLSASKIVNMSMAIFSPKLPTLPSHYSNGKTHFNFRPHNPIKRLEFHLVMRADISSGVATTDTPGVGSNGSPPAAASDPVVVESANNFQDARWVRGTWDLKQFVKNGETDWDAVIDAGWSHNLNLHSFSSFECSSCLC